MLEIKRLNITYSMFSLFINCCFVVETYDDYFR